MADTVYARLLERALELDGSTQGIVDLLRVPEATLSRWRSGRAFMPVNAFRRLLDYVAEAEANLVQDEAPEKADPAKPLQFTIGPLSARCERCDGVDFRRADTAGRLTMASPLVCCNCGMQVVHRDLVARVGNDFVEHNRIQAVSRGRALNRSSPPIPSQPLPISKTRSS